MTFFLLCEKKTFFKTKYIKNITGISLLLRGHLSIHFQIMKKNKTNGLGKSDARVYQTYFCGKNVIIRQGKKRIYVENYILWSLDMVTHQEQDWL